MNLRLQFKDVKRNKFVAVVVDGEVMFYGAGKKRSGNRRNRS